jgi:polyisoprenoid-binding protein YceI
MKQVYSALLAATVLALATACAPAASTAAAPTPIVIQPTAAPTEAPVDNGPATEAPAVTEAAPVASSARTFVIDSNQSVARFYIQEVLAGQQTLVIGTTSAGSVEGSINADYANPAATTVGVIRVNMSTLATDNNFRNGRLHSDILQTNNDANRYAEFSVTSLSGLPASITIGQAFTFQINGTLTMHGVSKDVTFNAEVTPVSETQLNGKASLTVTYADWGIQILRLPSQVASVEPTTTLELEFVATAQ